MHQRKMHKIFLLWIYLASISNTLALELSEAEQIALNISPELQQIEARRLSLDEESVAEGQFPDPMLSAGFLNVPVDTFAFSQEPMTQVQFGVQQSFPKGRSLQYAKQRKQHLSIAESQQKELRSLQIIRFVRLNWLDLLYWTNIADKTNDQKNL